MRLKFWMNKASSVPLQPTSQPTSWASQSAHYHFCFFFLALFCSSLLHTHSHTSILNNNNLSGWRRTFFGCLYSGKFRRIIHIWNLIHSFFGVFVLFRFHIDLATTQDCYYNYNHYSEGDRILTNEPCLNCTCHNKMLMCYLKVCPFTKPIGQDCTIEKREDQCCPIITCPEGKWSIAVAAVIRKCHNLRLLALVHAHHDLYEMNEYCLLYFRFFSPSLSLFRLYLCFRCERLKCQ